MVVVGRGGRKLDTSKVSTRTTVKLQEKGKVDNKDNGKKDGGTKKSLAKKKEDKKDKGKVENGKIRAEDEKKKKGDDCAAANSQLNRGGLPNGASVNQKCVVKTVRSPAPSPSNRRVVNSGTKIQAQRKFAQAGNVYTGTLQLNSIPSHSPYATPSKESTPLKRSQDGGNASSKKVKKPMFSPPPCKRPKTTDFLTFLCVRGTPALPPELDYFNYPQAFEAEPHIVPKKKFSQSGTATEVKELQKSETKVDVYNEKIVKLKGGSNFAKPPPCIEKSKKVLEELQKKAALAESIVNAAASSKAENPTKGIRATASSVLFSKLKKTSPVLKTRPILSPPRSRLNEQDARFAITALKLKRMAVNKTNHSALLAKKAKERRSIILTRSSARTPFGHGKLSQKRGILPARSMKPIIISPSRSAPSPDIIYGVTASSARKRAVPPSSDESEHEAEEDEDEKSSAEENGSSAESEDEQSKKPESFRRSLRSGREAHFSSILANHKVDSKKKAKSPQCEVGRVGTRSAHRLTKSPFREMPMYNSIRKDEKNKMNKKDKKKQVEKQSDKKTERQSSSSKKPDRASDYKRPSRKTKETAANLLGLLTKSFSTDDDDSDRGRKVDNDDDSDVGSSSSSDNKYLEKHYNAALRREEESMLKKNRKNKTESTLRSSRDDRELRNKKSKTENDKSRKKPLQTCSKNSEISTRSKSRPEASTIGDKKMPGAARKSASISNRGRAKYSSSDKEDEDSSSAVADSSEDEISKSDSKDKEKKPQRKSRRFSAQNDLKIRKKAASKTSKYKGTGRSRSESENENDSDEKDVTSSGMEDFKTVENKSSKSSESKRLTSRKDSKANTRTTSKRKRSSSASSNKSFEFKREESVETEHCRFSTPPNFKSQSSKHTSSSEEEDDRVEHPESSAAESCDDDDEYDAPSPERVDMSTQVDMDEEEGLAPAPSMTTHCEKPQLASGKKDTKREEDSDDDVVEIGQVFASSTHQKSSRHSDPTAGISSSSSFHQPLPSHQLPHFHQPQHSTPTLDPLHNNPFSPFRQHTIQPDFYAPLQLAPPLVHSSIQLVGSSLGAPTYPVANPLNTLSIPVSVPFASHLLPHHPSSSIGFATGSTYHSTTLQTHIRSVATNLDIPLVRPVMGTEHSSINFMSTSRGPSSIGISSTTPLTRPSMAGVWGVDHSAAAASRSHYSAFRVPHGPVTQTHTTQQIIHHQSTTVLGMNSTPILPVSIIQPQTNHHQTQSQYNQQSFSHSLHHQGQHFHNQSPSVSGNNKKNKPSCSTSGASLSTTAGPSQQLPSTEIKRSSSNVNENTPITNHPPGYNLIKHLPNVSIVPKFDRNSANNSTTSTTQKQKPTANNTQNETVEKKKCGRKRKDSCFLLPKPTSPLTVRKDSNPTTYAHKKISKDAQDSASDTERTDVEQSSSTVPLAKSFVNQKGNEDKGSKSKIKPKIRHSVSPAAVASCTSNKRDSTSSPNAKTKKIKGKEKEPKPTTSNSQSTVPSRNSSPNVLQSKPKGGSLVETFKPSRPGIMEAPTFHPSEQEFEDPLKYIQQIQKQAEKFGMARIVPPRSFRPECNVEDDMRFTAYNHYIHKMYQRWGPNVLESEAIKENLKQSQSQVDVSDIAMIGGMEINLSSLYQTVKSFGGLTEVLEKQKWVKVADALHVPKAAHDRSSKLDAIYVKYVLPYETLSDGEREKLKKKTEKKWSKRREDILKMLDNSDDEERDEDSMDELDECIVKGKTTPLSSYYRVARNTLNMFFPTEKEYSCDEIEEEYWNIVRERNRSVCVYSGSIDCAGVGWGFPTPKTTNKHPWNLKVLANNQGSVLRSMGPVMGATVPTLHVAMIFTSYCWYRDPHGLPWVEYLHSGANKIWYSVAAAYEDLFRSALTELMPMQCKKKKIWLPSDSAMVPPEMLVAKGIPLVRAVQKPGEFLIVFPKAYTSAICTGYLISESVCFAYPAWIQTCLQTFKDIQESKEPPVFPLEKLLLSILKDARASLDVVRTVLVSTKEIIKTELSLRSKITSLGVKYGGKINADTESKSNSKNSSKNKVNREEETEQCHICNYSLYLSVVKNSKADSVLCLKHAIDHFSKHKADIKKSIVLYDLNETQLETIIDDASKRCGNGKS